MSEFTTIQSKFNPEVKVSYLIIQELKSEIYYLFSGDDKINKTDSKEVELDEKQIETGLNFQRKSAISKANARLKIISLFFQSSISEIENLGYDEVEELWKQIETAKPELISFLKLS